MLLLHPSTLSQPRLGNHHRAASLRPIAATPCLWVLGKEGRGKYKVRGRRDMIDKGDNMSTRCQENPTTKEMGPFQLIMELMKGGSEDSQLSIL